MTHAQNTEQRRWRRIRFSLRGLLICTFGIAVGFAEGRRTPGSFSGGLLAAVSAWAAIGLVEQVRDLRRHFHRDDEMNREQRCGVRFAIAWRALAVGLWVAFYALRECESAGLLSLPERTDSYSNVGKQLRTVLVSLLLLIVASRPSVALVAPPPSFSRNVLRALAVLAAGFLAMLIWWDQMTIPFFVHLACEAISSTTPARYATRTDVTSLAVRYQPFIWASVAAVSVCALNFICVSRLARGGRKRRWPSAALVAVGVPASYVLVAWLATAGLSRASPFLYAGEQFGPVHVWMAAVVVVVVLVTVVAYRWCARPWDNHQLMFAGWRRSQTYLHERTGWAALLAVGFIAAIIEYLYDVVQYWGGYFWLDMLVEPENLLRIALLLAACLQVIRGLRHQTTSAPSGIAALDPSRFTGVWASLFLVAPTAVAALAALSFALWLTPWYKLSLPGS